MKKSLKRTVALFLTFLMTTCSWVMPAGAAAPADIDTGSIVIKTDFSDVSIVDNKPDKYFSASGNTDAAADNVAEIVEEGGNKYFRHVGAANDYRLSPFGFYADAYTISGDFMFNGEFNSETDYVGFIFSYINPDDDADRYGIYYHGAQDRITLFGKEYTGFVTAGNWYSFRLSRYKNSVLFTMWKKGEESEVISNGISIASVESGIPCISIMGGGTDSGVAAFDDLCFDTALSRKIDFENESIDIENSAFTGSSMTITGDSKAYDETTNKYEIMEEDGNKYFRRTATTHDFRLSPVGFGGDTYTVTAKFKMSGTFVAGEGQSYVGFNFRVSEGDATNQILVLCYAEGLKIQGKLVPDSAFAVDEWCNIKIVRSKGNITVSVWKDDIAKAFKTIGQFPAAAEIPTFRCMSTQAGEGAVTGDAIVAFDDIHFENKAESTVSCIGMQGSDVSEGKYTVRFIGTVDSLKYVKVGFEIKATTEAGDVKKFYLDSCELYSSIIANEARGIRTYSAEELGGKYLMALSIHNIPVSAGNITFEVKALYFVSALYSVPVVSDVVGCTVTLNDAKDTVSLAVVTLPQ